MAVSLKAIQFASSGMWSASLGDAAAYPNPETTGSSSFTFAMAYGINAGFLDAATYTPVVTRAWQGLSTIALQGDGLVGWCQPAGASPGEETASSTSDFCVGLWLLAASEVYKLAGGV